MSTLETLKVYGHAFQIKVLHSLLNHREFLHTVIDSVVVDYFENSSQQWIVSKILDYYEKFHTNITMEVLQVEVKKLENEISRIAITEQLKEAYTIANNDLPYIEQEFLNFCKNQQLKSALLESVDLLNGGDYEGIRNTIDKAMKAGADKNLGHIFTKDMESRYRDEDRNAIPFPWPIFNQITQGGIGSGDLVLLFGNPGGGKTWAAIAMGAHAASLGYKVLHYTLELGEGYTAKRYDAYLTGIPVDKLHENKEIVNEKLSHLKGEVIIREYSPKRASLDTIERHIQQLKSQFDFEPDLIIIDYLDLLKNRRSRKERKDDVDDIYTDAKGLAKQLKKPIISPSQVNRAGAKDSVIEGDKIAGSYDKIMIGDISISLSRKRQDKLAGTGRWHIMKNRYGPDGMVYGSKIDTSMGHIEILESDLSDMADDDEEDKNNYGGVSKNEKKYLKDKFLEHMK